MVDRDVKEDGKGHRTPLRRVNRAMTATLPITVGFREKSSDASKQISSIFYFGLLC